MAWMGQMYGMDETDVWHGCDRCMALMGQMYGMDATEVEKGEFQN